MKELHISAGGRGDRISAYISSLRSFLPKHLLPLPTEGKSILGEIAFQGRRHFDEVTVWSSKETYSQIVLALADLVPATVKVDGDMTGPLGPMVRSTLSAKARTFGCAGDFYCDFSWTEFERFHEQRGLPVSILVAKSIATPGGARFNLDDSARITSWERVERTTTEDRINIGCYILDPVPEVLDLVGSLDRHKEDLFFDQFIPRGLVAGYDPGIPGFNVNVGEVYESLINHLGVKT